MSISPFPAKRIEEVDISASARLRGRNVRRPSDHPLRRIIQGHFQLLSDPNEMASAQSVCFENPPDARMIAHGDVGQRFAPSHPMVRERRLRRGTIRYRVQAGEERLAHARRDLECVGRRRRGGMAKFGVQCSERFQETPDALPLNSNETAFQ